MQDEIFERKRIDFEDWDVRYALKQDLCSLDFPEKTRRVYTYIVLQDGEETTLDEMRTAMALPTSEIREALESLLKEGKIEVFLRRKIENNEKLHRKYANAKSSQNRGQGEYLKVSSLYADEKSSENGKNGQERGVLSDLVDLLNTSFCILIIHTYLAISTHNFTSKKTRLTGLSSRGDVVDFDKRDTTKSTSGSNKNSCENSRNGSAPGSPMGIPANESESDEKTLTGTRPTDLDFLPKKDYDSDTIIVPDPVNLLPEVKQMLEVWNESGMRKHKEPRTNVWVESVKCLQGMVQGVIFARNLTPDIDPKWYGKCFSVEDWKLSVERASKARDDVELFPIEKRSLKSIGLNHFIYNPMTPTKSFFLFYLENEPLSRKAEVTGKYPLVAEEMRKMWVQKILGGNGIEFSVKEKNTFETAAEKVMELIAGHKSIPAVYVNTPYKVAVLLFDAVEKAVVDKSKVGVGILTSSWVLNRVLQVMETLFPTRPPVTRLGKIELKKRG